MKKKSVFVDEELAPSPRGCGVDKIQRYGWKVVDARGVAMKIHKRDLLIDDCYQRAQSQIRAQAIAREWSWFACGAIVVARRHGSYYVVDGGHRVAAAMKRSDIEDLDCIVFETESASEEAEAFYRTNQNRRPMRSIEKFRALLTKGDPVAISIDQMIREHGLEARDYSYRNGVACLGTLLQLAAKDMQRLRRVFALAAQVYGESAITSRIVDALFYIDTFLVEGSVQSPRFRSRLISAGPRALENSMAQASAFYARGGDKVWAKGIMELVNKGLRQRFSMRDSATERPE